MNAPLLAATSAAGLIESALHVVSTLESVRWCAYLTAGELADDWRVVHGSGDGAPEPGARIDAKQVALLTLRRVGGAAQHAAIAYSPAALRQPELAPGAIDALHRLLSHVHALLEHLPGLSGVDHQPAKDPLTGLMTESTLRARLDEEVARAARYGGTLSVIVVDVDETSTLERVREAHLRGNVVSEPIIQVTGKALAEGLRQMDCAGRLGPDCFLVLLPETGAEEALGAAARLGHLVGQTIEEHVRTSDTEEAREAPTYELRAGVSTFPLATRSASELLDQAETALRETRDLPDGSWVRHALPQMNETAARGFRCVCRRCGQIFEVDDRAHQRARRFCSHACYVADRRQSESARDGAIRQLRTTGSSLRDIAQRYSISPERVRQICMTPAPEPAVTLA